jgi:nuclear GTP-binding protein
MFDLLYIVHRLHYFLLFQHARVHILETETFENTFGPKAHRKKPNIKVSDMEVSASILEFV